MPNRKRGPLACLKCGNPVYLGVKHECDKPWVK